MPSDRSGVSRRGFLKGVGAAAVVADGFISRAAEAAAGDDAPIDARGPGPFSGELPVVLSINGKERHVTVEPRTTLLSAIRDRLEPPLTGPKLVCDAGTCGACTVAAGRQTRLRLPRYWRLMWSANRSPLLKASARRIISARCNPPSAKKMR